MCDLCHKDDVTVNIGCLGFKCNKLICIACSMANQVDLCKACRTAPTPQQFAPQLCATCRNLHTLKANETCKNWTCMCCKRVHCSLCYAGQLPAYEFEHTSECEAHAFTCQNCSGRQGYATFACTLCSATNVCCKEDCGKFGNSLYVCNRHSARCHFCNQVAPLIKTGAPRRMYCLETQKYRNQFYCCSEHLPTMHRLIIGVMRKQYHLDLNVIAKIMEYCRQDASAFDHRNKRIKM